MSENRERPSNSSITWIVGCFSAVAIIIAAIIGLGAPFAERIADRYFPTLTPVSISYPPTEVVSQNQTPNSPSILPTATQQVLQPSSVSESSQVLLGLWEWRGNRPQMPPPADVGQVIFANGDIDNSGTCHVKEFGPGIPIQGLGEGRFELWLITGTPEQIASHESIIQQGSASDPNNSLGTCPRIP
jgi:hypothetical protein